MLTREFQEKKEEKSRAGTPVRGVRQDENKKEGCGGITSLTYNVHLARKGKRGESAHRHVCECVAKGRVSWKGSVVREAELRHPERKKGWATIGGGCRSGKWQQPLLKEKRG